MTSLVARRDTSRLPLACLAAAAAVYLIDGSIARSRLLLANPAILAPAVTFDLTIFVTLLYWALVVRRGLARPRTTLTVLLASIGAAALTLPPGHRDFVLYVRYLAVPAELAVMALVVIGVRRARGRLQSAGTELDVPERIRAALEGPLDNGRIVDVLATEIAMLYYAVASWRRRPFVARASTPFSCHRRTGSAAVFYTLAMASIVELVAVHFLLRTVAPRVAFVVLAVSVFATLWLVGFARAVQLRPVLVDADTVHIRSGMAWSVDIPRADVVQVEAGRPKVPHKRTPGYLRAMSIGQPNVLLTLRAAVAARGPYGRIRTVERVSLALDDPRGFAAKITREENHTQPAAGHTEFREARGLARGSRRALR